MITTVANLQNDAGRLYQSLVEICTRDLDWNVGEGRVDEAFDILDEVFDALKAAQSWQS